MGDARLGQGPRGPQPALTEEMPAMMAAMRTIRKIVRSALLPSSASLCLIVAVVAREADSALEIRGRERRHKSRCSLAPAPGSCAHFSNLEIT